jgi:Trp operon repressor
MTEAEHLDWDAAENALADAMSELLVLLSRTPDEMQHTATRNRITMAAISIEQAQDQLSAARARIPKEGV